MAGEPVAGDQITLSYLTKHSEVQKVIYPSLHAGEIGNRAKKYLSGGFGALCGVELKGGIDAGILS